MDGIVVSSIRKPRTPHAVATVDPLNMDFQVLQFKISEKRSLLGSCAVQLKNKVQILPALTFSLLSLLAVTAGQNVQRASLRPPPVSPVTVQNNCSDLN
jgi:hypothetical protein